MKTLPNIAVVIPIHNADSAELLELALHSICEQSYSGSIDMILCVDGPIDLSLQNCIDTFKFKHIIKHPQNRGIAANLNSGITWALNAKYPFIARMDADDISHSNRLEIQIDYANKHPEVDIIGTQCELINEDGDLIGHKSPPEYVDYHVLKKSCAMIHPSVIFRSRVFKTLGLYNISLKKSQDYDLWFRAIQKEKLIRNIPKPLIQFRYNQSLIKRRKKGQIYSITVKKHYLRSFWDYIYLIPNFLVIILPNFIIRALLSNRFKS